VAVSEPIRTNITHAHVTAVDNGMSSERTDALVTEEPLEIRVQGRTLYRTPAI
jgi:formate dehydrogenase assembly factor FdhD